MQSAKQKISNLASAAKEHITICTAKVEEQTEKATAATSEEREIAKERRKAKEAKAKMELHEAKARHAAQKLNSRNHRYGATTAGVHNPVVGGHHHHGIHDPAFVGTGAPTTAAVTGAPAYPPTVPMGTQYPAGPGQHYV
ncbi:Late embryogenesis abundant protein 6 [Linum perenne]